MSLLADCLACSSILNTEAVGSFETSVNVYHSTMHYIPEDNALEEVYYLQLSLLLLDELNQEYLSLRDGVHTVDNKSIQNPC